MKFPKKLSKERLSLLSEEDRKIYEMEHSGLYSLEPKVVSNVNVIDEDARIRRQMDQFLFESQFDDLFDKEIIEAVGEEEYMNIKKNLYEFIENDPEMQGELFEAPGHAADWWMDFKIGWLGKLAAGLLTGLLGLVAWLLMKGKDRLAMVKLKQYMNKLVELIDMGVNKKRPWYSFLMLSKKKRQNTGDYNKACFRTIQETAERNMACLYTQCIHNLGFLDPNLTDFRGITSGLVPMQGSGLDNFRNAIEGNIKNLTAIDDLTDDSYGATFLPIQPDLTKFQSLKLPALPTNYTMLMCNIEYPAKADKNPNGSLFMKPTQEILQAKAEDIGLVYFNENLDINDIIHWDESETLKAVTDAYNYALQNPYVQLLLEAEEDELNQLQQLALLTNLQEESDENQEENKTDLETRAGRGTVKDSTGGWMTDDTDNEVFGRENETHTEGKRTTKVLKFEGNVIEAIDGYLRNSIPIVLKLIRAICGQNAMKNSQTYEAMIALLINAGEGNITEWFKKEDTVIDKISKNIWEEKAEKLEKRLKLVENVTYLRELYGLENADLDPNSFYTFIQNSRKEKEFKELLDTIKKEVDKLPDPAKSLDERLKTLLGLKFNEIVDKYDPEKKKKKNENESLLINVKYSVLYEGEVHFDDEEIMPKLAKSLDTTYNKTRNYLTEQMGSVISADPSTWYIITSSRDRMNKLKEAADKEITAKIDLICRLAGEGKTDIGDKFKSAISKHPLRAEGLKRIWAMYSDDLLDRIETRIRSITGDNGNSNILDTIKLFLVNVYPNLIATMLYYKLIFFLTEMYTQRFPIPIRIKDAAKQLMVSLENAKNLDEVMKRTLEVPDSTPPDASAGELVLGSSEATNNINANLPNG